MAIALFVMTAAAAALDRVSLGFLSGHLFEVVEISFGVLGLLTMLTFRHDLAGLNALEQALAAARDWTLPGEAASKDHPSHDRDAVARPLPA
jgi:hypothetical protein